MSKQSHLVAMGGGGFSMEAPDVNSRLDDHILRLTGKKRPKVCFIGTASGDAETYHAKFLAAFPKSRAEPSILHLFRRTDLNPRKHLLEQDVIYVGGGNTANLLQIWRLHGVDKALRQLWKRGGIVFAGVSAGMNCWFEGCSTDSFGPLAPLNDGLGIVRGAACPHFDGDAHRRPSLTKFVATGKLPATYAADDFAAFHFVRSGRTVRLVECIKSQPQAGCYFVEKIGRSVRIESLPTRLLK
jgi:peptidase E